MVSLVVVAILKVDLCVHAHVHRVRVVLRGPFLLRGDD